MPPDAKILIVDDHEDTLYALESALAPLGYHLTRATNGDDALKEVLRGHVGLLLLDVRMPGVSGLDVVRYMRARGTDPAHPDHPASPASAPTPNSPPPPTAWASPTSS